MINDDQPVGRVLSRREVLALFGAGAAAVLSACVPGLDETAAPTSVPLIPTEGSSPTLAEPTTGAASSSPTITEAAGLPAGLPSCIVRPEQTEGPFFLDEMLNRADIRANTADGTVKQGTPLQLTLRVAQISGSTCAPLAGAVVDLWQCDAQGVYSGVQGSGGEDFLRGYQVTDENGAATFTTIYPGWYPGRTVHIHFKIRTGPEETAGYEFTSQFYFEDSLSDQVLAREPYSGRGNRSTQNAEDFLYRDGGDQLTLSLAEDEGGYRAVFDIGLQLA